MEDMVKTSGLSLKTITWIVYILQVSAFFFALPALVGIIINLIKLEESKNDPMVTAHFRWQMRTFWWSVVWAAVGSVLFVTVIGIPIALLLWIITSIWFLYRVIRGMMTFSEGQLPKPGY